ncbi:MAG: hypothetical protein A2452_00835 [Candidatus Firestonebacteria bacterium RIFOXYC2_FULL_39_67]|nr:MAG: hypothetical protein A2536_10795 [Candidatus Firestonebacteria bacterium RIFOXYD2_FULL_39_29]OGF53405.1 MAG: hypothetical protein A2497_03290 [Candidatus Firestonebacteria bacterium RifOxyC12_full_39_7]OGF54745.1 MAG: hypothetical protein A2452_00835 [Candidatus Firestonebacteria bacterium RIFOXYC2_FULL_39_67]
MKKLFILLFIFLEANNFCEAGIEVSNISVARSRLEHQVFFSGSIGSNFESSFRDVSIKLVVLDRDLKVLKESDPVILPYIYVNSKKDFNINIKGCPYFEVYDLKINYSDKKGKKEIIFHGSDLFNPPQQDGEKKDEAVITILSQYIDENGYLKCIVRNSGESDAGDLTLNIKFLNVERKLMKEKDVLLEDGKIGKGKTKTYNIKINNLPDYTSYQVLIKYSVLKEEKVLVDSFQAKDKQYDFGDIEYGSFTAGEEVEVAKCRFLKKPGSLEVKARIRNGKMLSIRDVTVYYSLLTGKNNEALLKTYKFNESIYSKAEKEFNIVYEGEIMPSNYKYEVKYEEFIPEKKETTFDRER